MKFNAYILVILLVFIGCKKTSNIDDTNIENPLEILKLGNNRFVTEKTVHKHQNLKSVYNTQNKQKPIAVVVTCADSRVEPDIIFDQGIGDLFIIKNAGNILTDIDLGSVEYAVEHLQTKLVVILGHTECGAVKAFVDAKFQNKLKENHYHISTIVDSISQEVEVTKININDKNFYKKCIFANVQHGYNVLVKNELIKKNDVLVKKMIYDIHTGKIQILNDEK